MFHIGENDILVAKTAPNGSFLEQMYRLKNENPIKIIQKEILTPNMEIIFRNNFWFGSAYGLKSTVKFYSMLYPLDFFFNEKPFFSILNFFLRYILET